MRIAVLLSFFLVLGGKGICEEASNAEPKKSENIVMGIWRLPPGFVSTADPSDKTGARKPLPGFKAKQTPNSIQFDATEFLKTSGVEFPPGSEAVYDQSGCALVVRNTQENLDLVDVLLGGCRLGTFINLASEISTFECVLPEREGTTSPSWLTYDQFQKLPKQTIKLLDRVSVVTKSGDRATMNHIIFPSAPKVTATPESREELESAGLFQDGETGTIADCESIVGPDGVTIDSNLNYRFRNPLSDKFYTEISFKTSFTTWEGYPIVLHISPVSNQQGKFVVVIGNIRVVNFGGWNHKEAANQPEAEPNNGAGH